MRILYIPFILQGLFMGIDEVLHAKRGLGVWERLGHPLDSLTVLIPLGYISLRGFTDENFVVFVILSIFSCFFITKDEFIHKEECSGFESWLHSILFILHPLIFLSSGILWKFHPEDWLIRYQPFIVGLFMSYQIIRWSVPWKQAKK